MPTRSWVVVGSVAAVASAGGCALLGRDSGVDLSSDDHVVAANARVVEVVDGDTLVVDIDGDEERVRLIGLDTPESVAPNRPVECHGVESSHRMAVLIPPGTPVRLERDIEARDMYDRLLAYVYRAEDGLHINLDQVAGGHAEAMPFPPNTVLAENFAAAESAARAANAGLWGACGGPDVPVGPPPTSTDGDD